MYQFHYKYIRIKFNTNVLFTDTDSLVYETKTDDIYEDFNENKICLILMTIRKIQCFLILSIKTLLVKLKMKLRGK